MVYAEATIVPDLAEAPGFVENKAYNFCFFVTTKMYTLKQQQ